MVREKLGIGVPNLDDSIEGRTEESEMKNKWILNNY